MRGAHACHRLTREFGGRTFAPHRRSKLNTIPMGLCYDCGFGALTVALALRLPGDCLPLGGPGGTDQHGELAVVEQAERAEQLTADRDRFSL